MSKLFDKGILRGASVVRAGKPDFHGTPANEYVVALSDGRILTYERRLEGWDVVVLVRGRQSNGDLSLLHRQSFFAQTNGEVGAFWDVLEQKAEMEAALAVERSFSLFSDLV